MSTFAEKLEKYASLAVEVGVNIQPGQTLFVTAPIETKDFVKQVTKIAYQKGAKDVMYQWTDDELTRLKYELAPSETFQEFPIWKAKEREELAEQNAAFLSIVSSNPDLLKGIEAKRIQDASKAAGEAMKTFRSYIMSDKVSWSIVAVPNKEWADKVFPTVKEEERVDQLWDAIFQATRVDLEDPVAAWRAHTDFLDEKAAFLNNSRFKALHYKAEGTDLTIELPKEHIWVSAGSHNQKGTLFIANMPTEEVFTTPLKTGVNGVVKSTKPLSYAGNVIEGFTLTFKNGEIIDYSAEEGYEALKQLIETDEGSKFLGEVALVPHDSPISNTDLIFYNTLFDENASNHLAIGSAYAFCIEGGKEMSKEELEKVGCNDSITHVDFMIGSADMAIDGITSDGDSIPVFRNGNWA